MTDDEDLSGGERDGDDAQPPESTAAGAWSRFIRQSLAETGPEGSGEIESEQFSDLASQEAAKADAVRVKYRDRREELDLQGREEGLQGRKQDRGERLKYAQHLFRLTALWLVTIGALIVLDGFGVNLSVLRFDVPTDVLAGLLVAYVVVLVSLSVDDAMAEGPPGDDPDEAPTGYLTAHFRQTAERWAKMLTYGLPVLVFLSLADVSVTTSAFDVPANVMVALAVTTTATVLGLFTAVTAYLFHRSRLDAAARDSDDI